MHSEAGVSYDAIQSVMCDIMEAERSGMCILIVILTSCYFLMIRGSETGNKAGLKADRDAKHGFTINSYHT